MKLVPLLFSKTFVQDVPSLHVKIAFQSIISNLLGENMVIYTQRINSSIFIMYINNKITYKYECKYNRWSFVVWIKFNGATTLHQLFFTRSYNLKNLFKSLLLKFYLVMHIFQQGCACWPWVVIVSIQNGFNK